MNWAAIQYRDFYDVPRIFIVSCQGMQFLFDCPFDDELDDYQHSYRVYQLPSLSASQLAGSWEHLPTLATAFLGTLPVAEVQFDATKRQSIDVQTLTTLLAKAAPAFN